MKLLLLLAQLQINSSVNQPFFNAHQWNMILIGVPIFIAAIMLLVGFLGRKSKQARKTNRIHS